MHFFSRRVRILGEDDMERLNLFAGWIGILLGFLAGALQGMLFHKENWLGGYASWPRRMLRLGHISFFGIGFINVLFAVSVSRLDFAGGLVVASWLFVAGAISMPLCCYLSAFRRGFRHTFFVPVLCLIIGAVILVTHL